MLIVQFVSILPVTLKRVDFVELTSKLKCLQQSRRSYTAYKLDVANYAEENGSNMAAQRKYGVNEKVIRGWRNQKGALRMTKKSRKALRVHEPHWPALEKFVLEQSERAACRGLNTVQLHMNAIELAKSHNIDNFKSNAA